MNANQTRASLTAEGLTVRYSNAHLAIHDLSFSLEDGTICALVGVNGSGKSTLFKCIMDLVRPQSGHVEICGLPVKQALKQNLVAYVPQAEEVDWSFPVSVHDVVMQGRYGFMNFLRRPSEADRRAVDEAMKRLEVDHLAGRQIGELSGGQKKRVFLARAIAQESVVILLDEPFTGVDIKTENAIMDLLKELRSEGKLILVSTHNLGTIPDYCDRVVMIHRTVIAAGPVETTYTQENLEKTFSGALRHVKLSGSDLHDDEDDRALTVITDDERAAVFYGRDKNEPPHNVCLLKNRKEV